MSANIHSIRGRKKKRSPTVERIENELRGRIAAGVYSAHSYMPAERELSQELDVSRRSVSAALMRLAEDGLVIQTPGRGTRVLPPADCLARDLVAVVCDFFRPNASLGSEGLAILPGIEDTLSRLGYRYELKSCDRLAASIDTLLERYGALVFLELSGGKEPILELERRRVPFVVANLEWDDVEVSATWVDHRKSTMKAVKTLADFGHRRIAYIGSEPDQYFYGKAQAGYIAGLAEAGIPLDESLIAVAEGTPALDSYLATRAFFGLPEPPTAIVAARDKYAEGVCRAVREAGLVIGRDVSVIGFDDITWPQDEPFLTTFREPCYEMGAVAAEMLSERIVGGWRPPEKRELEAPLILRRSAGPFMPSAARRRAGEPGGDYAF